jgi:hypothetical protein
VFGDLVEAAGGHVGHDRVDQRLASARDGTPETTWAEPVTDEQYNGPRTRSR